MPPADQFSADVIGENFRGRFIVDGTTRLPAQIVYAAADSSPVTMTFGDRREVSGYSLPFRISIVQGSQTIEDLVFDEILVNPEIGKKDFRR